MFPNKQHYIFLQIIRNQIEQRTWKKNPGRKGVEQENAAIQKLEKVIIERKLLFFSVYQSQRAPA